MKKSSQRFFVHRRNLIDPLLFSGNPIELVTTEKSILSTNQNCFGREEKRKTQNSSVKVGQKLLKTKTNLASKLNDELLIDIPKQTKVSDLAISNERLSLFHEIISNRWPLSNERIENLTITNKRCQFSNEAISIKPITAVPGIGQKYGQLLANHGFIYARQLLGYYMMLKDNEMFRKWLEYRFNIPTFRAVQTTSALNEFIRQIL